MQQGPLFEYNVIFWKNVNLEMKGNEKSSMVLSRDQVFLLAFEYKCVNISLNLYCKSLKTI